MKTSLARFGGQATILRLVPAALAALLLASCGGGGGAPSIGGYTGGGSTGQQPTPAPPPPPPVSETPADPIPSADQVWGTYWNMCANPRTGVDPYTGQPFPDKQGTLLDEMKFLRGWADAYYLWYNEIPTNIRMANYSTALDYFNALKTPALTESGKAKDRYHFTYSTEDWDKLNNSGIDLGYGVTWSRGSATAPRNWLVTLVEPGSPAAAAGLKRGDLLLTVDGVDFVNGSDKATVDKINAGLFPEKAGEVHRFTLRRNGSTYEASMPAAEVSEDPVKNVKVIDTAAGKVGYLSFESHNAVSELELMNAFSQLKSAGVTDLVLDMRYNGGGLLYVASELAYMVAGPAVGGKVFERPQYNDKTATQPAIPFRTTAYGFQAPNPAKAGTALPYLGLKRVTVLTTAGTCSASEAVINGLRGVDVEVNVIGAQTCGKPYGFTPIPNCGTTYFSIEFKGVNAKGFGDYADGIAPTCAVPDDLTREVGDPAEGLLAAALSFNATGACPVPTARAKSAPLTLVRPEVKEIAVHTRQLHP
ncbi:MAG TPA: S41 family peptidase [Telluria sp.]|nr:S41 family peptidase [Telluria sp.]